jgi:hypothetical protein
MTAFADLVPLLGAGTAVVAGRGDRPVESVVALVGPPEDVGRTLRRGPEIVVMLTPLGRFDARFDVLLRRAADAGVAVVVVDAHGAPPIGPGTVRLAERLGVAVATTPTAWEASVRITELLGTGEAPAARRARRTARIGLDAGPALEDLFVMLDAEFEAPVRFFDGSGQLLRGPAVGDQVRAALALASGTSIPTVVPDRSETVIAAPVGTGLGPRGWLAVGLRLPPAAEVASVTAGLEVAAVAAAHRLVLTRLDDERDARYRSAMLDELRALDGAPGPALVQRTLAAGWRLEAWHIGVRLVARTNVDHVALRRVVAAALEAAGIDGVDATVVEQPDGWAVWRSSVDEPGREAAAGFATAVRRAQAALRATVETNVGVGSLQPGASGLVRSLGEAADAARLAAGRPESGYFVHVDRLGLAQLLLAWTQTDTFLPAAEQLLAPLEHGGPALLETLSAYLDAESSVAETAAVLGVHRNTVADRVARVQRLLGVDLQDPETRLALHLATRATGASEARFRRS